MKFYFAKVFLIQSISAEILCFQKLSHSTIRCIDGKDTHGLSLLQEQDYSRNLQESGGSMLVLNERVVDEWDTVEGGCDMTIPEALWNALEAVCMVVMILLVDIYLVCTKKEPKKLVS
jgi:hypothetical protein